MRTIMGRGECTDPVLVLAAGLALGWHGGKALAAVERLAAGKELAVYGADSQGVRTIRVYPRVGTSN
ncbi:hypothetical protein [Streptomyces sp. NPDC056337]|uniref:hypothetical protein n=1 Tax=Streptomyces sp. NPDC056337 TaxID=3345787 RepID=UPI0035DA88A5